MHRVELPMNRAPRCGARTRKGKPCRSPAVGGKHRCRMHGGAHGSGAQPGNRNAFRHGHYAGDAAAGRAQLRELLRIMGRTVTEIR
jgi:glucans biosynthesis protein